MLKKLIFLVMVALLTGVPVMAQNNGWSQQDFSLGPMNLKPIQVASLDLGLMSAAVAGKHTTEPHQCAFLTSQAVRQIDWQRGEGRKEADINWNSQAIVVSDTAKVITMANRGGETETCRAPAGLAYVVNKTTWEAELVLICLNPVEEPRGWKVSGLFISKKEETVGLLDQQFQLLNQKLDVIRDDTSHIRKGVDELLARPPAATKLDVKNVIDDAFDQHEKPKPVPVEPVPQRSWWSRNWGWVAGGVLVVTAVALSQGGGDNKTSSDRNGPKVLGMHAATSAGMNAKRGISAGIGPIPHGVGAAVSIRF